MSMPEATDFEMRRSASEGYNLASLKNVKDRGKEKEKEKGKEKEREELIFGDEGVGEAAHHTPVNNSLDDIDVGADKRGTKKDDKTPSRSMTLTKKWFGSNAWK